MYDSSSRVYKLWLAPALFWKSGAKLQKYNGTVVLSVPLLSFAIK
jgi:hypothetical protein